MTRCQVETVGEAAYFKITGSDDVQIGNIISGTYEIPDASYKNFGRPGYGRVSNNAMAQMWVHYHADPDQHMADG